MDAAKRQLVRDRAGKRCEYCRLPDAADEWPFHVDHIVARVHGGSDDPGNCCWSCTQCNLHKSSNFASIDPHSGERVDLFNPRIDVWREHFSVAGDGRIFWRPPAGAFGGPSRSSVSGSSWLTTRLRYQLRSAGTMCHGACFVLHLVSASSY